MNDLLHERIAAADPAARDTGMYADDDARRALARILATPAGTPLRSRARRRAVPLALAGALVAAGVAVSVVATPSTTSLAPAPRAHAATPPLLAYDATARPARAVLLGLAERAAAQPRHAQGRYDFVRTRGWYLDGRGNGSYELDVAERRFWVAPDGSGRIDERRTAADDGADAYGLRRSFGPGGLTGPAPIPPGGAALRTRLYAEPAWDGAQWLDAVQGVWGQQVVEPDEQAALLRALAEVPGLVHRGNVTDRAGRPGVAVTTDSSRTGMATRSIVVLDAETGALLDAELVALDASQLEIEVGSPATFSYTLFLESTRTASTGG